MLSYFYRKKQRSTNIDATTLNETVRYVTSAEMEQHGIPAQTSTNNSSGECKNALVNWLSKTYISCVEYWCVGLHCMQLRFICLTSPLIRILSPQSELVVYFDFFWILMINRLRNLYAFSHWAWLLSLKLLELKILSSLMINRSKKIRYSFQIQMSLVTELVVICQYMQRSTKQGPTTHQCIHK